jgi:hypothetical protein
MPNKDDYNATIIQLVEGFLENRIDAQGALSQWPNIETERNSLIKEMWHRLTHFVDDADIRKDDASYEAAERLHIRRLLEKWRARK